MLAAVIVVLALFASPAAAATWLPPADAVSDDVQALRVEAAPDGTTILAWVSRVTATGYAIRAAVRPPGGAFGAPQDLGPADISAIDDLDLAVDG